MEAVFDTIYNPNSSPERRQRRNLIVCLAGLAVFLAWQAFLLKIYIRSETRPPSWDQSIHMEIALDYAAALKEGRWSDIIHLAPKPGMPPFPPLYHLGLIPAYSSPDPASAALWLNWFYFAVLCLSLFAIAYEFRPGVAALAATIAFCSTPVIQQMLTTQLIDLPVAAVAAAAYWALLRCEGFRRWLPSLLFAVLFAAGMMLKWSFFSYMLPAYYLAVKGLSREECQTKILVCAGVALAGFAPWYLAHLPILAPRLLQASADMSVPFWKQGAFLNYLLESLESAGPFFWVLGWVGLFMPIPREEEGEGAGWIILAWVLSSYIFWTIVPNRQMRFFLPGMVGLGVAVCRAWPAPLLCALAAFQLFIGANCTLAWLSPVRVSLPLHSFLLFPTYPPAREDWRIADILRRAQQQVPAQAPVANLTLVANAPYFNGPNFTWLAKYLKLPNIRIRGVNRRLCEFSQFIVLKTGSLGPDYAISGLPEAAAIISDRSGWFLKSYREVGRWPLPDGSEAVLYQQKRLLSAPFKNSDLRMEYYGLEPFLAKNFKVGLGPWSAAAAAYPLARAQADAIELRGLQVERLAVELEDLALVPIKQPAVKKLDEWDDVRFLRMKTLRIKSAFITAESLKKFLEDRVKGLKVEKIEMNHYVSIAAALNHISLSARASVELLASPKALRLRVEQARLGITPLPLALLGPFRKFDVPLEPNPEMPFFIDIPGLTLRDNRLSIP